MEVSVLGMPRLCGMSISEACLCGVRGEGHGPHMAIGVDMAIAREICQRDGREVRVREI